MERAPEYSKTVEVAGKSYVVNHPQVEEAWDIGIELLKMIGGSAASIAGGAKDEETAAAALSVAVNGLLTKVEGPTTMRLMKRVLRHVEYQGDSAKQEKKLLLDEAGIRKHFHGMPGGMLRLTGEVLAFTHKDFFLAIADGVAELMKMVAEKA